MKIACVGVLKGVQMALCGVWCVNLKTNTIKILGIHFSYNRGLNVKIACIGVLKGVQMAFCGVWCVNLKTNTIKILGVHFSYNRGLESDENCRKYIIKIEKSLKLWRMWQLTIEGKIVIFKTLAILKVVHLALLKDLLSSTIAQLDRIQHQFMWRNRNFELKHIALCDEYKKGGQKRWVFFPK